MKNYLKIAIALLICTLHISCTTTYDAKGCPVQTINPTKAIAGVAAVGIVCYVISQNNNHNRYHNHCYVRAQK